MYTGRYYSDELQTIYEFVIEDSRLIAKHLRHNDIGLTIAKQDMFTGDIWFFGQIEFVRGEAGEISGCQISSGRVRNVKFEKIK
jgi:hypothetical protein